MPSQFREFESEDSSDNDSDDGSAEDMVSDYNDLSNSNDEEEVMEIPGSSRTEANEVIDENLLEDEVVIALKAEKNKPRDHPPTITSEDFIVDICFHPARNLIALANIVGDVLLYEYDNDENKLLHTLELHTRACRDVEFDFNGMNMYSVSKDKSVMVTDVETTKLSRCYENAHDEPIYSLTSLDNFRLVTGDDEGTVKLWDTRKPDPIFSIKIGEEHVSEMITNDSEKYLVCAGGDGVLTSIDLKGRKIYTTSEEYDSELTCLGLFRSNTKLLAGSSKGKMYLFNWKEFGFHSDEYTGNKHAVSCMVGVTENIAVTSGEDGVLRASHLFPQRQLGAVGHHALPVDRLDISHDGTYIASASHNDDVKFWNISYFETIENLIDVSQKQNKRRDMSNNLPSSTIKNASDFFSGLT